MDATIAVAHADKKSTNGRFRHVPPTWLTRGLGILARVWPGGAERVAAWLFCRPGRAQVRDHEAAVLGRGVPFRIEAGGRDHAVWSWGEGPLVLLHHGWGGNAGQMTAFVAPLVDAGYRVVAYDGAAHGRSSGHITSAPSLAMNLREIAARLGGAHAVVAHSIGSAATLIAIRNSLPVERAVLLAPPSDMRTFITFFGKQLGLPPRIRQGILRRTAAWFDVSWSDMCVEAWARGPRPPLLVFHDDQDLIVPVDNGKRIAEVWENAEFVETRGLGHNGVRRDAGVVARVVDFVKNIPVKAASTG